MAEEIESEIKGVFNISDIDKFNFSKIDSTITNFKMNINNLRVREATNQLQDILTAMLLIEKYFSIEDIKKQTARIGSTEYTFYQLKDEIDDSLDIDDVRLIIEKASEIYGYFEAKIGVVIPTMHTNIRKKLSPDYSG